MIRPTTKCCVFVLDAYFMRPFSSQKFCLWLIENNIYDNYFKATWYFCITLGKEIIYKIIYFHILSTMHGQNHIKHIYSFIKRTFLRQNSAPKGRNKFSVFSVTAEREMKLFWDHWNFGYWEIGLCDGLETKKFYGSVIIIVTERNTKYRHRISSHWYRTCSEFTKTCYVFEKGILLLVYAIQKSFNTL
jgi:IS30 family transposase